MTKATRKKMKKGAWSPEARAKAAATRAANQAKRKIVIAEGAAEDALFYLLKAEGEIIKSLSKGAKRIGAAETLTLLALNTLRGEA